MHLLLEATHTFRYAGSILSIAMKLEWLLPTRSFSPVFMDRSILWWNPMMLMFTLILQVRWVVFIQLCWLFWQKILAGAGKSEGSQYTTVRRHPNMLGTLKLNTCKREKELIGNWSRCNLSLLWTSSFSIHHILFTTQTSTHSVNAGWETVCISCVLSAIYMMVNKPHVYGPCSLGAYGLLQLAWWSEWWFPLTTGCLHSMWVGG